MSKRLFRKDLKNQAARRFEKLKLKLHLGSLQPLKGGGGQFEAILRKAHFAAGDVEHRRNLVGENALTAHAGAEMGIVEFAGSDGADAVQHFVLFSGSILLQPLFKNRCDPTTLKMS